MKKTLPVSDTELRLFFGDITGTYIKHHNDNYDIVFLLLSVIITDNCHF